MKLKTLLLFGTAVLLSSAASAADLGPIYREAPELVPVEIGTGWYLRGDVTYDFRSDLDGDRRVSWPSGSVAESYNQASLDEAFGGGAGIGYRFTDMLRADVTARYSKADFGSATNSSIFCTTQCAIGERTEAAMWDVMANAYVDLGTVAGFTPYIGGGLGAVHVGYDDTKLNVCNSALCSVSGAPGQESWRFAWSLSGGVAYDVSKNLALDIGYRYLNAEGGDVYKFDGASSGRPGWSMTGSDGGFERHTISAGLRYSLW
ncbi:hypothetical protein NS365_13565 [Aureimonas ureilytica]|uniref:Outer membrane protein beta-barrel domain-containing protein n=1 Tax=Aureimonas ureilytica TaxID=401562 RepID=A0A175RNZ4_9HYPH|nr:outer membrane beta-barrel protein [Aureimonas ureilytica]KTR05038.1 hypothetical protein NS365_13565 [Aureimonas ureilytica]